MLDRFEGRYIALKFYKNLLQKVNIFKITIKYVGINYITISSNIFYSYKER